MSTPIHSPTALGRALRDARRGRGWSQQELAELAGVSQPTVSSVERGRTDVALSTLLRMAAVLGLELLLREAPPADPAGPWEGR